MALERTTVIRNSEGLHFRPIMRLVDCAGQFQAKITVRCEERVADGRSPMELLMLMATCGKSITISAEGDDAGKALDALTSLVESSFGEK